MADDRIVQSYLALEKLALAKMDDAEKVQWYQARTISAEEALAEAKSENEQREVVEKFPLVELADLSGLKTRAEMETVAARIQGRIEKAKVTGHDEVEAAIKEALKLKDEEIVNMRKVYGKARQPQAGDVTGSQIQGVQQAAAVGIGAAAQPEIKLGTMGAVNETAKRTIGNLFGAMGLGGNE